MINSSIDSPNHRIYHTNKNIEKKIFFEFLPQKRGKNGENLCQKGGKNGENLCH
jgi:hypothetical protein